MTERSDFHFEQLVKKIHLTTEIVSRKIHCEISLFSFEMMTVTTFVDDQSKLFFTLESWLVEKMWVMREKKAFDGVWLSCIQLCLSTNSQPIKLVSLDKTDFVQ